MPARWSNYQICSAWFCIAVIVIAMVNLVLAARIAQTEKSPPIPLDLAKQNFALAEQLASADDGKLWKMSLRGPLLFADAKSRFVVANQPDLHGQLMNSQDVWTGTLPPDIQIANTSLEWSGIRWTMVVWGALAASVYDRGKLLMHESMHRIQPELGFAAASPSNAHLDAEEGRIWMRLEMRALAEAMIWKGERQLAAAGHAMTFRAMRHARVGETAAREESALEFNEGICEYTGFKLCGLPTTAIVQRVAVDLAEREQGENFSRSFAYGTGTAICLLLDVYDDGWRSDVANTPDLAARLAKALSVDLSAGIEKRSQEFARLYQGHEVFAEEASRRIEREKRLADLRERFIDGRVLRIDTGPHFRFSFNPNTAQTIDANRVVHTPFSGSDQWGTIDAPEGAMIDFNSPMCVVLPIPENTTVEKLPWKLELAEGYRLDVSDNTNWQVIREKK